MKGVDRGDLPDKGEKIDGGIFIGAIGNGPDDRKRYAELETYLRNCRAFHLHSQQIGEVLLQFIQSRGAADEFVAAGNQSAMHLRLMQAKNLALIAGNFPAQILVHELLRRFGEMDA